jgi:phosphotransferase system  glucose/maltose/N-acetylglucosamine-specific IIC component
LLSGAVPELQTEPIALTFHLAAECATAICLIVGGIALLRQAMWARNLAIFASGMLAYTVVVSSGYFAQRGQWPLVGMFAILLILDLVSISIIIRKKELSTQGYTSAEPYFRSLASKLE